MKRSQGAKPGRSGALVVGMIALLSVTSVDSGGDQPCWFSEPYGEHAQGTIGIASRYGSGDLPAKSRHRAVKALAATLDAEPPESAPKDRERLQLGGADVKLASTWRSGGYYFSYAYRYDDSAEPWVDQRCEGPVCRPQACEPDWLCSDADAQQAASVVTVSQRAANQREQYRLLFENALTQMQALFGVEVESYQETLIQGGRDAAAAIPRLLDREQSQLDYRGSDEPPVLVLLAQCAVGDLIYARVALLGAESPQRPADIPRNWHEKVSIGQRGIEIGRFSGHLSIDLLSSKIHRAVENGLVQLAREEGVHMEQEAVEVRSRGGGVFFAKASRAGTQQWLRAQLHGVRFTGSGSDLKVHVLLEQLEAH